MVERYLLICSCGGQEKKARDKLFMLSPVEAEVTVVRGRDNISKLARRYNNEHLKALAKLTGRYSYYVEIEGNKIITEIDLIRGRRLA